MKMSHIYLLKLLSYRFSQQQQQQKSNYEINELSFLFEYFLLNFCSKEKKEKRND